MSDALDALRWRDELLQIMFWLRGEGLGEAVCTADLLVFLAGDAVTVGEHLERLAADGFATPVAGRAGYFTLSERGITEGGRRFADEFAGLTGQAHGECNNPNCSCHILGPEACEAHVAQAR